MRLLLASCDSGVWSVVDATPQCDEPEAGDDAGVHAGEDDAGPD